MQERKSIFYDVFVSYRWIEPDRSWVRHCLVPALKKAGLKVCLDVEDFLPGRDLILEMERAGMESRQVICVISPDYFEGNRMVGFEHLMARRSDPMSSESRLIPLILRQTNNIPERMRGIISVDWTDKRNRHREWEKLLTVLGVKYHGEASQDFDEFFTGSVEERGGIGEVQNSAAENREDVKDYPHKPTNITPYLDAPDFRDFLGRKHELRELNLIIDKLNVVQIYGEPGVGKTYLAAQFSKRICNSYRICWLDRNISSLDELLMNLNVFLKGEGESGFDSVYSDREASVTVKSAALIQIVSDHYYAFFIDNFQRSNQDEILAFVERFCAFGGKSRLIVISQTPLFGVIKPSLLGKIGKFVLQGLGSQDGVEYISERVKQSPYQWSEKDIHKVTDMTAGHPLAINLIAQWHSTGVALEKILSRLEEYDKRSGAELHQRLLEDIKQLLTPSQKSALSRLSVFHEHVRRSAWAFLDVDDEIGETLLQYRLLTKIGDDAFQMHPVIRKFWYFDLQSKEECHVKAGRYYWQTGKESIDSVPDILAYLTAHDHFVSAGNDDLASDVVNELVCRLHQYKRLFAEELPGLRSWLLDLNEALFHGKHWLLLEKGRMFERESRFEEAEIIFQRLYQEFTQSKNKIGSYVSLHHIGKALFQQKKVQSAKSAFCKALEIALEINDKSMQIRALSKIVSCHAYIGSYDEAMECAITVEELAIVTGDELGRVISLYLKGKVERIRGNFANAQLFLSECEKGFAELTDIYRRSKTLSRLGIILGHMGQYTRASENFELAIELKKSIDDRDGIARDTDYLGDVYTYCGTFSKAILCYKHSLQMKLGANDTRPDRYGQIKTYNNLAKISILLGFTEDACSYLSKPEGHVIGEEKRYAGLDGTRSNHLGDLMLLLGEYEDALQKYADGLKLFSHPYPTISHSQAISFLGLGRTYMALCDIERAKENLTKAYKSFKSHGLLYYEAFTLTYLARLSALVGRIKSAATLNEEAVNLCNKINAEKLKVDCYETQGIIEEYDILREARFDETQENAIEDSIKEKISRVWKHYDKAIQILAIFKASYLISRIKVRKTLWLMKIKFLQKEPVPIENAHGLLREPFAKDALRLEFKKARNMMNILHSLPSIVATREALYALQILSPLAMRMGFNALRVEIDELAFAYLYPAEHQNISCAIKVKFPDRENFTKQIENALKDRLEKMKVKDVVIEKRSKEIYSIYRKQKARQVTLNEILDLVAFRVITSTEEDCYKVLSVVQDMGETFEGRGILNEPIRDYIQTPKKSTGYQSIHVNILFKAPELRVVEFQIRTARMHLEAETGFAVLGLDRAAHWRYKSEKSYSHTQMLLEKNFQRVRVRCSLLIECEPISVGAIGEIARSYGRLIIWSVNIDKILISDTNQQEVNNIVIYLDLGVKSRHRNNDSQEEHTINNFCHKLLAMVPNCHVYYSVEGLKKSGVQIQTLSIKEKSTLLYELTNLSQRYIYVLTRRGDVKKLTQGATVLDFAYSIHSELGHRCKGAKVNEQWKPIEHRLVTGDRVEVFTRQNDSPSRDWLKIVKTSRAKSKIQQWIRRHM
jgi:tetratricopeptide (TPR) repeat protein